MWCCIWARLLLYHFNVRLRDIVCCNVVYMEHSAVLVRILASCCRKCRAFCVWLWIFPVNIKLTIQGWWVILDHLPPGNFFQKSRPSHRSLTQGCALYHSARTFDPSLHYRSFGRSLSLCLHRGLKLSGPPCARRLGKKKSKKKDSIALAPFSTALSFLFYVLRSPIPCGPCMYNVVLSLVCCIVLA